jgi:curved DNA-binding protein CbpA
MRFVTASKPDASGDLARYPFPRLLFYLYKKRFAGELKVKRLSGETIRIVFRKGVVFETDLANPEDVLAQVLLEKGWLDSAAYNDSMEELAKGERKHGQILLTMKAITRRQLVEGLIIQLRRKLNRFFFFSDAQFELYAGEPPPTEDNEAQYVWADPLPVIHNGVTNAAQTDVIQNELAKLKLNFVQIRSSFAKTRPRYQFPDHFHSLLTVLERGSIVVEDVLRMSDLGDLETKMILYTLWVTETLAVTAKRNERPSKEMRQMPPSRAERRNAALEKERLENERLEDDPPMVDSVGPEDTPTTQFEPQAPPQGPDDGLSDIDLPESDGEDGPTSEGEPLAPPAADFEDAPDTVNTGAAPSPEAPAPIIVPPPPEELENNTPAPIIVPPPPEEFENNTPAPIIVPPPPEELHSDTPAPIIVPAPPQNNASNPPVTLDLPPAPDELQEIPNANATSALSDQTPIATVAPLPLEPIPLEAHEIEPEEQNTHSRTKVKRKRKDDEARLRQAKELRDVVAELADDLEEKTHYQMLKLDATATREEVQASYIRLAKLLHPDRVSTLGLGDLAATAEEIFRKVNEANTVLGEPKARKEYDDLLEHGPDDGAQEAARSALAAEFAFQKGMVAFRKKNYREALKEFKEAFSLSPDEGEHLAWVAWTVFCDPQTNQERMLPRLKEQLLEAIKLSPKSASSHYQLGEVYLSMNDEKRAFTCFKKAIDHDANHVDAARQIRLMRMRREKAEESENKGFFKRFRKK